MQQEIKAKNNSKSPSWKGFFLRLACRSFYFFFITLMPLKHYKHHLGRPQNFPNSNPNSSICLSQSQEKILEQIIRAIKACSRIPIIRKCLPLAIATKKILQQYDIASTIVLGLRKNKSKLQAHAWLKINEKIICGGKNAGAFTPVAFFEQ